jgi:hypothetical protein
MANLLPTILLLWRMLALASTVSAQHSLRSSQGNNGGRRRGRRDQQNVSPYRVTLSTWTLGQPNPDAAMGNALKGLVESPIYTFPPYKDDIPLAVEFYYIGAYHSESYE